MTTIKDRTWHKIFLQYNSFSILGLRESPLNADISYSLKRSQYLNEYAQKFSLHTSNLQY